ncbi:unnamed protein product [Ambrosiozyma monospora]|uniref:Glutathione peroxidase n=1 Tax=Ambrosiozyma monospora TaxID=43982 RepID=A0A9W7DID7_AMBMO|nr:unnamed protein product [Ambrosiozyma monospora]
MMAASFLPNNKQKTHNQHNQLTQDHHLPPPSNNMSESEFYNFTPTDIEGHPFPFKNLKGKVVLIVNTASRCGFTKQYKELQQLYSNYSDQGLEIIAFPCNQFGGQEPGTNDEIVEFCTSKYDVQFPIMEKCDVNGVNESPIFSWLKDGKTGFFGLKVIKWNFEKFLIDKQGNVIQRYASIKTPMKISSDIEVLLNQ